MSTSDLMLARAVQHTPIDELLRRLTIWPNPPGARDAYTEFSHLIASVYPETLLIPPVPFFDVRVLYGAFVRAHRRMYMPIDFSLLRRAGIARVA